MERICESTRLTFKRDIIESLGDDDLYINKTSEGVFEITKKDIYKVFDNVVNSESYSKNGIYNYKTTPQKAYQFFKGEISGLKSKSINSDFTRIQKNQTLDLVGQEIRDKLKEIGKIWKNSTNNKKISEDILKKWKDLIDAWAEDRTLPLIIRKETSRKGQSDFHYTGREIVYADNSPAVWIYWNALGKKIFTISEIKDFFKQDEIPVMFIRTKQLEENAKYKKTLGSILEGWKLCHIDSVGFNTNKKINELDINVIKEHFKKFIDPNNMFLLPKEIGDLGEIKEFIEEQK